MHIGISGPIHIPSIEILSATIKQSFPSGMGGSPVNHEINALLEAGFKVSVFSLSPDIPRGKSLEWHTSNLSIYLGPYRKRARSRCFDFFYRERQYLKDAIIKSKCDVVHAHWQYEWSWGALDSKRPTLVTCHDSPLTIFKLMPDLYRFIRLIMSIIVLSKAKFLTTVSPNNASKLRRFTKKNIRVIPNFEADSTFQRGKNKIPTTAPYKIAMINNSFYGPKNVAVGVEAFNRLQKTYPKIELHLFGKSHDAGEDAFQWCRKKNMLDNVYFHGELPFNELLEQFSRCHLLLHTSLEESFGMVIIEAMAMGIPVVAGKSSGGVPWILKDGGGIMVDVSDPEEVSKGLLEMLDGCTYFETAKAANKIAFERFSKERVMKQYLEVLESLQSAY